MLAFDSSGSAAEVCKLMTYLNESVRFTERVIRDEDEDMNKNLSATSSRTDN